MTDADTITVAACPFCGHDDPEIDELSPGVCAVRCIECGCIGPHDLDNEQSPEDAVASWNRPGRTQIASDAPKWAQDMLS